MKEILCVILILISVGIYAYNTNSEFDDLQSKSYYICEFRAYPEEYTEYPQPDYEAESEYLKEQKIFETEEVGTLEDYETDDYSNDTNETKSIEKPKHLFIKIIFEILFLGIIIIILLQSLNDLLVKKFNIDINYHSKKFKIFVLLLCIMFVGVGGYYVKDFYEYKPFSKNEITSYEKNIKKEKIEEKKTEFIKKFYLIVDKLWAIFCLILFVIIFIGFCKNANNNDEYFHP